MRDRDDVSVHAIDVAGCQWPRSVSPRPHFGGGAPENGCDPAATHLALREPRRQREQTPKTERDDERDLHSVLGIGAHIFFNHWIGLQFELRDYIYKSNPGGGDVSTKDNNTDSSPKLTSEDEFIVSHLYFGVGLSFLFPPKAKISR